MTFMMGTEERHQRGYFIVESLELDNQIGDNSIVCQDAEVPGQRECDK